MKLLLLSVAILSTCFIKHVQTGSRDVAEKIAMLNNAAIKIMKHPDVVKKFENLLTSAGIDVSKSVRNTDENMEQVDLILEPEERDLAEKSAAENEEYVKRNRKLRRRKRVVATATTILVYEGLRRVFGW